MQKLLMVFAAVLMSVAVCARAGEVDRLAAGFADPPLSARPVMRWFWMDGEITRTGISKDLEAMKSIGIGTAHIAPTSWYHAKPARVKCLSEDWFGLIAFAGREADRLGMELGFHNCPGWSASGGPSVRPEAAQKVLRWTETRVEGGGTVSVDLPRPPAPFGWYREVAVLAVPVLPGEDWIEAVPAANDTGTFVFPKPRLVSAARFKVRNSNQDRYLALDQSRLVYAVDVSDDGSVFREHARFAETAMLPEYALTFPAVRAKAVRFRLLSHSTVAPAVESVAFSEVPRIPHFERKALAAYCRKAFVGPLVPVDSFPCPPERLIPLSGIVDLSDKVSSEGHLDWQAPKGMWKILRFGAVVQENAVNHIAPEGGCGLEVDKLSDAGAAAVPGIMIDRIVADAARNGVKAFTSTYIDSFEIPPQNWTERMPEEFAVHRGYDLRRFLPAFTGLYVDSTERTERFLCDFRRTIADLFAEKYGDRLMELVHERGLLLKRQAYLGPFDELRMARSADVPGVEFWFRTPPIDNACLAGSLANPTGRRIVEAEAFTDAPPTSRNLHNEDVLALKRRGDLMFARGVNRFELHGSVHQPSDDPAHRIGFWQFGTKFDRHHPDFKSFKPWIAYLSRAQFLLQQGRGVADVLYLADGPSPVKAVWTPELPFGWKGDCVDPEFFAREAVRTNGVWRFPCGMTYRVLVRPGMTAQALADALAATGTPPDFSARENGCPVDPSEIAFTHRKCGKVDVYFVANLTERCRRLTASFRAKGRCEVWNAWDGARTKAQVHERPEGVSELDLELPPSASRFILLQED